MRIDQSTRRYFEVGDRDGPAYEEKLAEYRRFADDHFEVERYQEFCASPSPTSTRSWSSSSSRRLRRPAGPDRPGAFPPHEHEKFVPTTAGCWRRGRGPARRGVTCARHEVGWYRRPARLHRGALAVLPRAHRAARRELTQLPFTDEGGAAREPAPPTRRSASTCARAREALVRMHVTSGTTGEPVAIGLTARDHAANSRIGGEAFAIAGLRPDRHDRALPQLRALRRRDRRPHGDRGDRRHRRPGRRRPVGAPARPDPALGIDAIFGTLSLPRAPGGQGPRGRPRPRALGLRHIVTAGEPGAGLAAVRAEIERAWGVTVRRHVRDERRLVDDGAASAATPRACT